MLHFQRLQFLTHAAGSVGLHCWHFELCRGPGVPGAQCPVCSAVPCSLLFCIQSWLHKKLLCYSKYTEIFVRFSSYSFIFRRQTITVYQDMIVHYSTVAISAEYFCSVSFLIFWEHFYHDAVPHQNWYLSISPQNSVWDFLTKFTIAFIIRSGVSPSRNQRIVKVNGFSFCSIWLTPAQSRHH